MVSVSVVIPAFNAATTVSATIRSVLIQSFSDLEVVVVDDGSSDDTSKVAEAIDDPRVRVIRQDNGGASAARNTGIRAATGDYIALLDADDLWYPDKLERQLKFMDRENATASQTAVWFVDNDGAPLFRGDCPSFQDAFLDVLLFRHLPAFPSTLIVDRKLVDQIGLFDENLVILEDWEFAIRVARHGHLVNLDEALTMYRVHPGNRSRDLELHIAPGFQVLGGLFSDPRLPARIKRQRGRVYGAMFTMLSGGALRSGDIRQSLSWGIRAIKQHPAFLARMAGLPVRKLKRHMSRAGHSHSIQDWRPPPEVQG